MNKIGILHPGEMGISIAASAVKNGHQVYWASESRSDKTRARAILYRLLEIDSFDEFCQTCEIIISICPPHAAEEIANSVVEAKFNGLYLDANAISPQRAIKMEQIMQDNQIRFVDGGIIGGPAWKPGETWLYLSGEHANEVASCFSQGPLETQIIGPEIGRASALKMCYAAYTKGTSALLAAILAASQSLGVRQELYQQWDRDDRGFSRQVDQRVQRMTAKAWRFEGEMREIAATFEDADLPAGFHEAAAEVYHRLAEFKDSAELPALDDILTTMLTH